MNTFAGHWVTTFGPMELTQEGGRVHGTYWNQGVPCTLEGDVDGDRYTFRYREPAEEGEGWFRLRRYGAFAGQWHVAGHDTWQEWRGNRLWDAVWETSFGRLRLVEEPESVIGYYEGAGPSQIEGRIEDGRLVFQYEEPQAHGDGCFALAEDAQSFDGQWRCETHARLVGVGRPARATGAGTDLADGHRSALAAHACRGGILVRRHAARVLRAPPRHRRAAAFLQRRGEPAALVPRIALLPGAGGRAHLQPRHAAGRARARANHRHAAGDRQPGARGQHPALALLVVPGAARGPHGRLRAAQSIARCRLRCRATRRAWTGAAAPSWNSRIST